MMNKEKICKTENSDYKKFLSLGFPKTAIEKFNICMKRTMKKNKKLTYIFIIFFLIIGCKTPKKKKLMKTKIILKLLFHVEKIIISKNISMMDGKLKKNTQKKKFVHGKQSLPPKIAI